jgi:hypothetical protein
LVSSSSYSSSDGFPARASNNISPAKEKQTRRQLMLPCSVKFTSKIYAVRKFMVGKKWWRMLCSGGEVFEVCVCPSSSDK